MDNHQGQTENWVKFLAEGENPVGMVAHVPDEMMINGKGGEFRPQTLDRQSDERVIYVREHTRKRR